MTEWGRLPHGAEGKASASSPRSARVPPPAFQTPAPAPVAEAPAQVTGLPDTGQEGEEDIKGVALAATARAGGPTQVFGPLASGQRSTTAGSNELLLSTRRHAGLDPCGKGGECNGAGCGLRLTDGGIGPPSRGS